MFSNIGNKLKGLAITLTVLGIISSLVYGIIVIVSTEDLHGSAKISGVIGGLLIIVLGSILSWVGSLALYGFGQLVDSAQNIEKRLTGKTDEYYSSPQQEVDMTYINVIRIIIQQFLFVRIREILKALMLKRRKELE